MSDLSEDLLGDEDRCASDLEWPACPFCYGRGHPDTPDDGTVDWYCRFCGGDGYFDEKHGCVTVPSEYFKMLVLCAAQFHHPAAKERYVIDIDMEKP